VRSAGAGITSSSRPKEGLYSHEPWVRLDPPQKTSTRGFALVDFRIGVFNEEDFKGLSQGASVNWGRRLGGTVTRATFEKTFWISTVPKVIFKSGICVSRAGSTLKIYCSFFYCRIIIAFIFASILGRILKGPTPLRERERERERVNWFNVYDPGLQGPCGDLATSPLAPVTPLHLSLHCTCHSIAPVTPLHLLPWPFIKETIEIRRRCYTG
jgi:hypothetical protein